MFKTITRCRACDGTDLVEVFNFGSPQALANNFTLPSEAREGFVPLRIMYCLGCTLAQLGEVVNPDILYKNYLYTTSNSETMRRHFDRLTKDIISENGTGSLLEVGSNDGLFLIHSVSKGFTPAVGVDPADNLCGGAEVHKGVSQVSAFFGPEWAKATDQKYDTIVARHCFCHQEWQPFMEACAMLAHKKTLICIEVPYAIDLLRRTEFDTIYHEHTSYLTIRAVVELLKKTPFHLHGVLKYGIHGGAVLLMLRHNDSGIQPHLSADEMLAEECVTEADWVAFAGAARAKIEALREMVKSLRFNGKVVSMFGASAKGTVLINACGLSRKEIDFCTDNSPLKPGRLIPGTQIPIIEEAEMLSQHPDYAICAAWNFRTEILAKMDKYRKRGGKFIFPTDTGWEVI